MFIVCIEFKSRANSEGPEEQGGNPAATGSGTNYPGDNKLAWAPSWLSSVASDDGASMNVLTPNGEVSNQKHENKIIPARGPQTIVFGEPRYLGWRRQILEFRGR